MTRTRLLVFFAACALGLLTLMPQAEADLPPGGTFVDDDGSTHEGFIEALVANGVTAGCDTEGPRFCPQADVTRGQMAQFLVAALDLPSSSQNFFEDDDGHIFEAAINALRQAGVTAGCNAAGSRFCPDDPVTRGQMAQFLANALDLPAPTGDHFDDDDGHVFERAINQLFEAGITAGCSADGTAFCPDDLVSRGQMATFIGKALDYVPTPPPPRSDGTSTSTSTTAAVPVNSAPVVTASAGSTAYTEGDPATVVDGAVTVSDADGGNLQSATVRISSGFQAGEDVLAFTAQPGIVGSYNAGSGVLTLTGSVPVATYQTVLRSVTFAHTGDIPSTSKTVEFVVNDGGASSPGSSKTVAVTPVNDAPVLDTTDSDLNYAEASGPQAIDPGITLVDDGDIASGVAQITANFVAAEDELALSGTHAGITATYDDTTGTLTLSGPASAAAFQTALRAVTYENSSANPTTADRTVTFSVTDDGALASNNATRDVAIGAANNAPVVTTTAGSSTHTEGGAATTVDSGVTVTDADNTDLAGATVRISGGFQDGDVLDATPAVVAITESYDTTTGVLTLTGTASVADYQTTLQSVTYAHTGDAPSTPKTVEFVADDGPADSNAATKNVIVTPTNDAPVLTPTATALTYTEGAGAVAIDPDVAITDDGTAIAGATVQITGNFVAAEDELALGGTHAGITPAYDDTTGTLTLSGATTLANYQAALRAVTYTNTDGDDPSTATRTVSFQVNDGSLASNVATRDITVGAANDAPVVTTSAGQSAHTEGGTATTVDPSVTVTDGDDTQLASASVRISAGFGTGDVLAFTGAGGIMGGYDTTTGVLTLTGPASVADFQTTLQSVTLTAGDDPGASKTVEFKVNDGDTDSNLATKTVTVTATNDGPTLDTTDAALSYSEGAGPVAVDPGITVVDPDSTQLDEATVQITGNFTAAEDELGFTTQNGITGDYDDTTGTLTLTGPASVANFQTALRSVTYANGSDNPSTSTRTVSFQATDDASDAGNVATRGITVGADNDAPVVDTGGTGADYTEGGPATTVEPSVTVTDADDTSLESATVQITSGFEVGDVLHFTDTVEIDGDYVAATGVLTLDGPATVAQFQAAMQAVSFSTTNDAPVGSKTVEFKVNDGDDDSNASTTEITVTAVNDAPVNTVPGDQAGAAGQPLTFSTANSNAITIADADATTSQVTLTATNGTVTLATTSGLTFGPGDGDGTDDAAMTFSGALTDINTAMDGMTFTPTSNGTPTSLQVQSNDGGNTGTGGTKTDTDTVTINLDAAPTVTSTTPANGATAASNADIVVNFSENVSYSGSSFTISCTSSGTHSFSGSGTPSSQTLNPVTDFTAGETCTVTVVASAVTDNDSVDPPDTMAADYVFSFSVDAAPSVTATNPANGATNVATNSAATVTFSEPVTAAAGAFDLECPSGTDRAANVTGGPTTFTITPTSPLPGGTTCTLTVVAANVSDNDAVDPPNLMAADYVTSFTTVNTVPVADAKSPTLNEDNGATAIGLSGSDADDNNLTFTIVDAPDHGQLGLITGIDCSAVNTCTATVNYTPDAHYNGPDDFTYKVNDGVTDSSAATVSITVTAVNDQPTFTGGANPSINEDAGAQTVNGWATSLSKGPADESAQTLSFNVTPTGGTLSFTQAPAVDTTTGNLTYQVAANSFGSATFDVVLTDNGSNVAPNDNTSPTHVLTITVNGINDAPTFTPGGAVTVNEDSGAFSATWATAISAGPNESGQTVSFAVTNNNNALFSSQPAIASNGTLTFTPANNAFGTATVTVNASDNGGTANGGDDTADQVQFTLTVNAVNDAPVAGADSFQTLGNTELRVDLDPGTTPAASETTAGGKGTRENDSDPVENDPTAVSGIVGCADATAPFDCTVTNQRIVMQSDGKFSYTPAPGVASGSFQYTLTDAPAVGAGSPASATGTVTMTVNDMVWYVNGSAPAGGNGTSRSPLSTFTSAINGAGGSGDSDAANQYIFVHSSNVTGAIELEAGQRLWGEGFGLSIPQNLNGNGSPTVLVTPGAQPVVTSPTAATVSATQALPAEIRGLSLASTGGNAIDVTAAGAYSGALAINGNTFAGATAETIDINGGATSDAAALTIVNNIWSGTHTGNGVDVATTAAGRIDLELGNNNVTVNGTGIVLARTSGTLNVRSLSNNTIGGGTLGGGISATGVSFDENGTGAGVPAVFGGSTAVGAVGNGVGTFGINLANVTGSLAFSQFTIVNDNGPGLAASGTTPLILATGGTSIVTSTNGPAVSLVNVDASLPLSRISSTTSTTNGVLLSSVTGSFTVTNAASAITNATGADFSITGGTATVTYPGTITDDAGQLVRINGATGGTKTFSGAISDGNDGDGGIGGGEGSIELNANTGATINFTGGMSLSTGANPAFRAIGGGTVSATQNNSTIVNTVATTTATAVNVANTTIGASDLTFRSISAGTATGSAGNGIVLDTTGLAGGLNITGFDGPDGGTAFDAGSGGTIRHKTGADGSTEGIGIYLNQTAELSLSFLQLNDFDNYAIHGRSVTNFDLSNTVINGVIGTTSAAGDAPVAFGISNPSGTNGLLGSDNDITDVDISGAIEHTVELYNQSGTFDLDILRANIHDNSAGSGSDGILAEMQGSANATITVDDSDFTNLKSQAIQGAANDNSFMDFTVSNSTAVRGTQGNEGFVFSNGANGDLTLHVLNNNISGYGGVAIFAGQTPGNATSSSNLIAVIKNNTIVAPASATNHAVFIAPTSTVGQVSTANILVEGNNITQNSTSGTARPMLIDTPDTNTTPSFTATVLSNTFTIGDAVAGTSADVTARRGTGCFDVRNNVVNGAGASFGIRVRQAAPATVNLERGVSGSNVAATVMDDNHPVGTTTSALGTITVVENTTCLAAPT